MNTINNTFSSALPSRVYSFSNINQFQEGTFFSIPNELIVKHFNEVDQNIEFRWNQHMGETSFPKYTQDKTDIEIAKEFNEFHQIRLNLHANFQMIPFQSNKDFSIAQNILINHRYRQPNCITFEHSKADDSYNCSCITMNGRKFFALEGPTDTTIENFYQLLANWNVSTLVCLTGEEEKGIPKCFPYWVNHTFEQGGETFFTLPLEGQYETSPLEYDQKKLNYTYMPEWQDHSGFDISSLINEVNKTRKKTAPDEIMAIHCSAGVGRTGTFLAIICLLEEIDKQIANGKSPEEVELSIAELFLRINFHRRQLISREAQYITVYRAVDYYLKHL